MPQDGRPARPSTRAPERESGEHTRHSGTQLAVEDIDLTPEQRERIASLFLRLGEIDFYALLEVPRTAEKKDIKRAYNAMVVAFHPDRFFRKRLGTFKPKLEAIFERMTDAYELLCDSERRATYDTALQTNRQSVIDGMLEEAMKEMAGEAAAGRYEIFDAAEVIEIRIPLPSPPKLPPPQALSPRELEERRKALARRLGVPPSSVPPKKPGA